MHAVTDKIYSGWSKLLTWFGDLYFATEPPKIKACHIRQLEQIVQVGDILCRRYTYYLDSHFIKGKYSHSGIYIGNHLMVHSVAEGVEKIDIIDFVKDSDGFIVVRPPAGVNVEAMISFAIAQIGKPYDFMFNKQTKNDFYCHELTFYSLMSGSIAIIPKDRIIYAEDILGVCGKIYEA